MIDFMIFDHLATLKFKELKIKKFRWFINLFQINLINISGPIIDHSPVNWFYDFGQKGEKKKTLNRVLNSEINFICDGIYTFHTSALLASEIKIESSWNRPDI